MTIIKTRNQQVARLFLSGLLLVVWTSQSLASCPVPDTVRPVPMATDHEISLATFNMWNFMAVDRDGKAHPAADIENRIDVMARWIVDVLSAPHLLVVQEVGSQQMLQRLIGEIRHYSEYDYEIRMSDTRDPSGIRLGLLYQPDKVQVSEPVLLFTDRAHGRHWLFARPPMKVTIKKPFDFYLVNVHLRSGHGLQEPRRRDQVLEKRERQAQKLRRWMQQEQLAGNNVIIAGDINSAPEAGNYSIPLSILDQPPWQSAWQWIDAEDRFSYIFRCQRQANDHILLPSALTPRVSRAAVTRGNAGRYHALYGAAGTDSVVSDHDALVVYLRRDVGPSTH